MSKNYWAERQAKSLRDITSKTEDQITKQLKRYYSGVARKVITDFESVYNKILAQQKEGKEVTPALLYKLDAYWQMQAQARAELERLGERQTVLFTKYFELDFFEVYHSIAIPGGRSFDTLDSAAVNQFLNQIWVADGKSFSQRIWGNTEKLLETLNDELIHCVVAGKKTSQLKEVLMERFNVSYNNADMIARTELAHIQAEAARKRYEDYGIREVEIWADADERRCDVCGKLHQKKYPIGAQLPIPAHPRCRCSVLPVVD